MPIVYNIRWIFNGEKDLNATIQNLSAGNQFQISVSTLAKGTYIVTIENNGVKGKFIIIKH